MPAGNQIPRRQFPSRRARDTAYPYIVFRGLKGYNGVAILPRPQAGLRSADCCAKGDAATSRPPGRRAHGRAHNFYVPAGGDKPDPEINEKFAQNLAFIAEMAALGEGRAARAAPHVLVGDLNIAPLEHDVWSHKALLNVVSHTPTETDRLNRPGGRPLGRRRPKIRSPRSEALHLVVLSRVRLVDHRPWPPPGPHLGNPRPRDSVKLMRVLRDARDWPRPSDHAPVMAELAL